MAEYQAYELSNILQIFKQYYSSPISPTQMFTLLNAYQIYYRKTYNVESKNPLFNNINDVYDTNHCIEHLRLILLEHFTNIKDNNLIYNQTFYLREHPYNPNDDVYVLVINEINYKLSMSIIALLNEVIRLDDWHKLNWQIKECVVE